MRASTPTEKEDIMLLGSAISSPAADTWLRGSWVGANSPPSGSHTTPPPLYAIFIPSLISSLPLIIYMCIT